MRKAKINWNNVYKLSPGEFPEDPDKYAEPVLIYSLGDLRQFLQKRMFPSPVSGALARFGGSETSQHYVGPKNDIQRKATGCDVFCEGVPFETYTILLASKLFNGIGIYLDTNGPDGMPWVMFHLDMRFKGFTEILPLIWIVKKEWDTTKHELVDKYRYYQSIPNYWSLLNNEKFFRDKQFNS